MNPAERLLERRERALVGGILVLGPLGPWLAGSALLLCIRAAGGETMPLGFFLGPGLLAVTLYSLVLLVPFGLLARWAERKLRPTPVTRAEVVDRRTVILFGFAAGLIADVVCLLSLFRADDLPTGRLVLYDRMAFSFIAVFLVGPAWLVLVAVSIVAGVLVGRGVVRLRRPRQA